MNKERMTSKLDFKPIKKANKNCLITFLKSQDYKICDYTYGVLYMWSEYLNYTYAVCDNMLIISSNLNGNTTFSIPLGNGDIDKALNKIEVYCKEKNLPLKFHGITRKAIDILLQHFGDRFEIVDLENWGEYLYNYEDLAYLKGKRYHSKRNHINQFKKLYADYKFKEIDANNISAIKEFLEVYYTKTQKDQNLFYVEKEMLYNVLDDYDNLDLLGGFIEVEGKVVAFAIGEIQNDVIYIHIEKADRNYKGSYAIINNEYLKFFYNDKIKYINREEDAGDLGLRKAKQSYYPVEIIKKFSVKEKTEKTN